MLNSLHYIALVLNETRPERVLEGKLTLPIVHIAGIAHSLGKPRDSNSVPYPKWSATLTTAPCAVVSPFRSFR